MQVANLKEAELVLTQAGFVNQGVIGRLGIGNDALEKRRTGIPSTCLCT